MNRRSFVKNAAIGSVALTNTSNVLPAKENTSSETLVSQLYTSLNEEQKKVVIFPFEHPLREKSTITGKLPKKALVKFSIKISRL
mgnify:CR=1 FL=1